MSAAAVGTSSVAPLASSSTGPLPASSPLPSQAPRRVYLTKHWDPAYRLLDQDPAATLEMVLDFRSGGDGHPEEGS